MPKVAPVTKKPSGTRVRNHSRVLDPSGHLNLEHRAPPTASTSPAFIRQTLQPEPQHLSRRSGRPANWESPSQPSAGHMGVLDTSFPLLLHVVRGPVRVGTRHPEAGVGSRGSIPETQCSTSVLRSRPEPMSRKIARHKSCPAHARSLACATALEEILCSCDQPEEPERLADPEGVPLHPDIRSATEAMSTATPSHRLRLVESASIKL